MMGGWRCPGRAGHAGRVGRRDGDGQLPLQGAGAELTTVDGSRPDRVFHALLEGALTLNDLTVRGGNGAVDEHDGGIMNPAPGTI